MLLQEYYEVPRPFVQNKAPSGMMYKIYTITIVSTCGTKDNRFALYSDFIDESITSRTVKGQPTYNNVLAVFSWDNNSPVFYDYSNSPVKTKYITGLFQDISGGGTSANCFVIINYDLVPYDKGLMTKDALIKSKLA